MNYYKKNIDSIMKIIKDAYNDDWQELSTNLPDAIKLIKEKGLDKEVVFPEVAHDDHPITDQQMKWIQTHPDLLAEPNGTFLIKVLEMPEELGTIPSGLYGPAVGDGPIMEEDVVYEMRGDRKGSSRKVNMPNRPARNICVIGRKGIVAFTIYGTQASEPSPKEPFDSFANEEEKQKSIDFWSKHALSVEA